MEEHGTESTALSVQTRYHYTQLSTASHIRVITLCPTTPKSTGNEGVHIRVTEYLITQCPKYEALSYTWGEPDRIEKVIVEPANHYIRATSNLYRALLDLRRKEPVTLWIDAICINQDDIQERSSQVRLMSRVYHNARQVIVWLAQDEASPVDKDAEDNETWTVVKKPSMTSVDPDERERRNRLPIEPRDYPIAEFPMSALRMFRHPWFMRIWILQEIAYAKTIIVKIGKKTTYWDEVLEWVGAFTDRASDDRNTKVDEATELSMGMVLLMENWRHNIDIGRFSSPLAHVLYQAQWCGATEPKDRVFAMLSLASDIDNDFQINYEWSWAEISTRLTRHTIEDNNSLDMLRCVGTRTPLSTTEEERSTPSWIPNLSGSFQSSPLQRHNKYEYEHLLPEDRPVAVGLCNDTTLAIKCLYLTSITHVEPGIASYESGKSSLYCLLDNFTDWFWAVRVHHSEDEKRKWCLSDSLNEFWSTIRMTRGSDAVYEHVGRKYDAGEGWHWHWRRMFADGTIAQDFVQFAQPEDPFVLETEIDEDVPLVIEGEEYGLFDPDNPRLYSRWARDVVFSELQHVHGRRFGITGLGQLGLFPGGAKKGDKVVLIFGIQIPFILRETSQKGNYEVVGAAYIHQIFDWTTLESQESLGQLQWIHLV